MTRTSIAALAVGALALSTVVAGCGDDSDSGLTTVRWAQPTPESMAYHPYVIADELGYFEEEGLDVELAPAGEDLPTTTLAANGSADLAAASANEILYAVEAGSDLTVYYDAMTSSPEGIVVPEDSDVQDVGDLDGATVGIPSEEEQALVSASLGTEGMSADDVSFVTIGGSGQVLADQLEKGEIDAFAGSLLDFSAVEAVGYPLRDITPEEIQSTPSGAIVAAPDIGQETLEGFLRAFARATAFSEEDPERTEEILRDRIPEEWQNEDVAEALLASGLALWTPNGDEYGAIDEQAWQNAQQRLADAEGAGGDVDLDKLLDDTLIGAVNEDW